MKYSVYYFLFCSRVSCRSRQWRVWSFTIIMEVVTTLCQVSQHVTGWFGTIFAADWFWIFSCFRNRRFSGSLRQFSWQQLDWDVTVYNVRVWSFWEQPARTDVEGGKKKKSHTVICDKTNIWNSSSCCIRRRWIPRLGAQQDVSGSGERVCVLGAGNPPLDIKCLWSRGRGQTGCRPIIN